MQGNKEKQELQHDKECVQCRHLMKCLGKPKGVDCNRFESREKGKE